MGASLRRRRCLRFRGALLGALLAALPTGPAAGQRPDRSLVVFNAGSLALPMRELLAAFAREAPGVIPRQESSGSLEAARKLTELGKVPDVLAVADRAVIAQLLMPAEARWYATFASNAMVLAYTARSVGAGEITGDNWWRILLRPGVRTGRSDPALDPNGYRTLMVWQLAERVTGERGLARRLEAAAAARWMRPKEADLVALLQAGELDYAWSYRSLARTMGLRWVELGPAVDLSDPARAGDYRHAVVRLPGPRRGGRDSLEFRGEPIAYALTIPVRAPNPQRAAAFVRFVLGPRGRAILQRTGFVVPPRPELAGDPPPGLLPP